MSNDAFQADDVASDDRLPAPETEGELQERLGELEASISAGEWEGVSYTTAMRAVLKRYALGEIGWRALHQEIATCE
jgi:hypothetical protein